MAGKGIWLNRNWLEVSAKTRLDPEKKQLSRTQLTMAPNDTQCIILLYCTIFSILRSFSSFCLWIIQHQFLISTLQPRKLRYEGVNMICSKAHNRQVAKLRFETRQSDAKVWNVYLLVCDWQCDWFFFFEKQINWRRESFALTSCLITVTSNLG